MAEIKKSSVGPTQAHALSFTARPKSRARISSSYRDVLSTGVFVIPRREARVPLNLVARLFTDRWDWNRTAIHRRRRLVARDLGVRDAFMCASGIDEDVLGRMDGWMVGWTDRRTEGWADGRR